jgi:hypothetical protein
MTRKLLEDYVIAWNKHLKDVVSQMSPIILLRNANPTYRGVFASKMLDEGTITKLEASEFVIMVGR